MSNIKQGKDDILFLTLEDRRAMRRREEIAREIPAAEREVNAQRIRICPNPECEGDVAMQPQFRFCPLCGTGLEIFTPPERETA